MADCALIHSFLCEPHSHIIFPFGMRPQSAGALLMQHLNLGMLLANLGAVQGFNSESEMHTVSQSIRRSCASVCFSNAAQLPCGLSGWKLSGRCPCVTQSEHKPLGGTAQLCGHDPLSTPRPVHLMVSSYVSCCGLHRALGYFLGPQE